MLFFRWINIKFVFGETKISNDGGRFNEKKFCGIDFSDYHNDRIWF